MTSFSASIAPQILAERSWSGGTGAVWAAGAAGSDPVPLGFLFLFLLGGFPRSDGPFAGAIREAAVVSSTLFWRGAESPVLLPVRAMGPAFLLRASRLNTGHWFALFAGWGPPQLAQVAGSSLGLGQSCAGWDSPHLTQAMGRWQLCEECRNCWHRWHCAGPFFPRHASIFTPGISKSSSTS